MLRIMIMCRLNLMIMPALKILIACFAEIDGKVYAENDNLHAERADKNAC